MTLEQWKTVTCDAVSRFDKELTQSEVDILLQNVKSDDVHQQELAKRKLHFSLAKEILARASSNRTFGDPARLRDQILYGSIEDVYSGASPTFLAVTRSFLTFYREFLDIEKAGMNTVLQDVISRTIQLHRTIFFPAKDLRTAAPYHLFAEDQRKTLNAHGQGIDVEDFFRSNPLLVKTINPLKGSGAPGSGCCILVLLVISFVIGLCC